MKLEHTYHEEVAHRYDDAQRYVADDIDGLVLGVQEVLPRAAGVASIFDIHQLDGPSLGYGVDGLRDQKYGDVTEQEGGMPPLLSLLPQIGST